MHLLEQVAYRCAERSCCPQSDLTPSASADISVLHEHASGPIPSGVSGAQFSLVRFNGVTLSVQTADKTFIGEDNEIYMVRNIISRVPDDGAYSLVVSHCKKLNSLYPHVHAHGKHYPVHSTLLHIDVISSEPNVSISLKPLTFVKKKCVCLPFKDGLNVVFPM